MSSTFFFCNVGGNDPLVSPSSSSSSSRRTRSRPPLRAPARDVRERQVILRPGWRRKDVCGARLIRFGIARAHDDSLHDSGALSLSGPSAAPAHQDEPPPCRRKAGEHGRPLLSGVVRKLAVDRAPAERRKEDGGHGEDGGDGHAGVLHGGPWEGRRREGGYRSYNVLAGKGQLLSGYPPLAA